jgi:hypothetical protein
MSVAALTREVRRLREEVRRKSPRPSPVLEGLRADPLLPFRAMGWRADPWQEAFLRSTARRESLLCSRRAGKSTATASRLCREALLVRGDYLVFCPTLRQSMEMLRAVRAFWEALGRPLPLSGDAKTVLEFANGSRVLSLPDNHAGVVGVGNPRLVVIDEGSRVSDELYLSVLPTLAETNGTLVTLSTPWGKDGWFFRIWDESAEGRARRAKLNEQWVRSAVTADRVPRITPEFLADARVELGERWFRQEFYLEFLDALDAVFAQGVISGARCEEIEPLF